MIYDSMANNSIDDNTMYSVFHYPLVKQIELSHFFSDIGIFTSAIMNLYNGKEEIKYQFADNDCFYVVLYIPKLHHLCDTEQTTLHEYKIVVIKLIYF